VGTLSGGLDPIVLAFGLCGAIWGAVADRIGARWPAHEDGSVRGVDWRSAVVVAFGIVALAMVPTRFDSVGERALFGLYFAALVLLMATDLDQRLMPDVVTLPLMALGLAALAWGGDSLVSRESPWLAIAGAVAVPGILLLISLPFGEGAFGLGDVKLLVSVGLVAGLARIVLAAFAGALLGGVGIVVLLAARRVTLKSYIPFGPFLIAGTVWAMLLPAAS
jgi:Type II secretory pathway, prepilin signal peptidase PulO and related peptidases